MSGPVDCTDSVESCKFCPRYMDDCDGREGNRGDDDDL